jgi:vacuolar protein sorting-associated protein 18
MLDIFFYQIVVQWYINLFMIMSTWEDALRTFLLRRLDNLTKEDKMQITMISTWAIELYLDKVPAILSQLQYWVE